MKKIISFVLIAAAFLTLTSLGYWQLQRLSWKESFIKKLDREYAQAGTYPIFNLKETNKLPINAIKYGRIKGHFLYDKEILVGPKPLDGNIGYQIITPLKTPNGEQLLVNRGWIEIGQKNQIEQSQPAGLIELTGLLRVPDWNFFTPNNSPENDIWTKLDIVEIAKEKGISNISPFMFYAAKTSKSFKPVILHKEKWYPRNKHKQYALFWFTMAFALIAVTVLFLYKEKRTVN